jgi:hypothetical protein
MTFETVAMETEARFATSTIVAMKKNQPPLPLWRKLAGTDHCSLRIALVEL